MAELVTPREEDVLSAWMPTFTGKRFRPLKPDMQLVCIEDIAHSLALQCRFAGHSREFYSQAEHCVRASWWMKRQNIRGVGPDAVPLDSRELELAVLMARAASAYFGSSFVEDVAKAELQRQLNVWAGLPADATEWWGVESAEGVITSTAARDLLPMTHVPMKYEPDEEVIEPWPCEMAESRFLQRWRELQVSTEK